MGVLLTYVVFALSVGIALYIVAIRPAIEEARLLSPNNPVLDSVILPVTMVLLCVLFAPILWIVLIVPNLEKSFQDGVVRSLAG